MSYQENSIELITSGTTVSYWTESVKPIICDSLKQDEVVDVVIVGGGISGLSVAYSLASKGKKVALIEDGAIGSGESGRTTAHLVTALDDRYYNLIKLHGENSVRLLADSHSRAIEFIEEIIDKENIDCDFERLNGYLFLDPSDKKESLTEEFTAAKKIGLNVEILNHIPDIENEYGACLLFEGQAQFHIMKYLQGLCNAIKKYNGKIYTNTHADKIDHTGIITDKGYTVKAAHVVVATNSPVNDFIKMHDKQTAYRTYAIGAKIKKGYPKALWWDSGNHKINPDVPPYHYVRLQTFDDTHDLLITGGEDHITGKEDDSPGGEEQFLALENWARYRFPIGEVIYKWSGQVMETIDGVAYIGRNPMDKDNVYIVTGDSGNGMTHGTIAGILITDLIMGIKNPWEEIYSPARFKILKSTKSYIENGLGVLAEFLSDYPGHVDAANLAEVKSGEGKLVEIKGEKYGAYRDEKGYLHVVSAVCPHMQCIVKWNETEKSWDCPCHGSRFTYDGKVMNGPSNSDLHYWQLDKKQSKILTS